MNFRAEVAVLNILMKIYWRWTIMKLLVLTKQGEVAYILPYMLLDHW